MVISHSYKFVYIGVPKTASTTLHKWFSQPLLCGERWDPELQNQHSAEIPNGVKSYEVIASIRHPLDRCVSLWAHSQSPSSLKHDNTYKMDFDEFVLDYQENAPWFYKNSQSDLLKNISIDTHVVFDKLEKVTEMFNVCGLEQIKHLNRNRCVDRRSIMTHKLAHIIQERWADDWKLGNWAFPA